VCLHSHDSAAANLADKYTDGQQRPPIKLLALSLFCPGSLRRHVLAVAAAESKRRLRRMPAEPRSRVGMTQRSADGRQRSPSRAGPVIPQMFTIHGTGAATCGASPPRAESGRRPENLKTMPLLGPERRVRCRKTIALAADRDAFRSLAPRGMPFLGLLRRSRCRISGAARVPSSLAGTSAPPREPGMFTGTTPPPRPASRMSPCPAGARLEAQSF
jgi:hypothetical protein